MRSGGVHIARGSHLPVRVRVPGFSPASRLAPPPALQVCFTLLTPFDFSLQGFPLPRSRFDSSSNVAVLPLLQKPNSLAGTAPWRVSRLLAHPDDTFSRLHGFALPASPLRHAYGLTCACARAPLGLSPLQGLPPGAVPQLLAAAPFVCLDRALPPKRNRMLAALQSFSSPRSWHHLF